MEVLLGSVTMARNALGKDEKRLRLGEAYSQIAGRIDRGPGDSQYDER